MPRAKYDQIYLDLKEKIEKGEYAYQALLPSENSMIRTYGCSRNTVRRAVASLVRGGYVQTIQGKGVRNIFRPVEQTLFTLEPLNPSGNPRCAITFLILPGLSFSQSFWQTIKSRCAPASLRALLFTTCRESTIWKEKR